LGKGSLEKNLFLCYNPEDHLSSLLEFTRALAPGLEISNIGKGKD